MFFFGGTPTQLYPAGSNAWSSTVVQVNPNYSVFTPGQAVSAQELNFLYAQLFQASAAGASVVGASWRVNLDVVTVTGEASYTGAKWDPISNRWLLCVNSSNTGTPGTSYVLASIGCGDADFAPGNASNIGGASQAIPPSPSTNIWTTDAVNDGSHYFAVGVGGAGTTFIYRTSGSGWAQVFSAADNTFDVRTTTFAGQICVCEVTSIAVNLYFSAVGDGASGHWSAFTGVLQGGDGINIAQNGSILVAFPHNTSGISLYATSVDGKNLVGHSTTGFMTATNETAESVCWSPADSLFFLATGDSGGNTRFYSSPDGLAWTLVSGPFAGFGLAATSVAATSEGILAAILSDASNNCFAVYSVNQAASWNYAPMRLAAPGFGVNFMFPKVVASPTGFCALNDEALRFSACAGTHAVALT